MLSFSNNYIPSGDIVAVNNTHVLHTDIYNGHKVVIEGTSQSGVVKVFVNDSLFEQLEWTKFKREGYTRNFGNHQVTVLSESEEQAKKAAKGVEKIKKQQAKAEQKAIKHQQKTTKQEQKTAYKEMKRTQKAAVKALKNGNVV